MALIPVKKWPDGVGNFRTADGKIYCGAHDAVVYNFSEIIDIDLTDLTVDRTALNPIVAYQFKLENDVVLKLFMWYDPVNIAYAGQWRAFYNNVEFTSQQYRDSAMNTGYNNEWNDTTLSSLSSTWYSDTLPPGHKTAKLGFFTFYSGQAVENVTEADSFGMQLFLPTERIVNTDEVFQDLEYIASNSQASWNTIVNVPYGAGTERVDFASMGWAILNQDTFNTYMKTAGKGTPYDPLSGSNQDPQNPEDDTSGTGGGGGSYDPTSDPIDFPSLPTGGALTSGMIKGFLIGTSALVNMQQKLWNMSIFDISTQFQKLVNQPLECLISLHCLPFTPAISATQEHVKLGSFDTEVNASRITAQYMEIDGGSITVPKYWGSALDYAPFSRVEIFLPFIGFRNLQIEDIQGLTLAIKYHVDVLTGDCVAYIKCGQSVLYSFTGNCLAHIPCMASSSDLLAKGIAAVGSIGVGMIAGNPASTAAGVISAASNVVTAKNHVQRSGDVAGSPGIMSDFTPYLVFHRPKQSLAKNYNKFKGYPSNITYTLSALTGYTEVEHVHLTNIEGATDAELQQIESLLKNGVII